MAFGHVDPGKTISYTNAGGTSLAVGSLVAVGDIVGIALGEIPAGATGELGISEVWMLPKTASTAIDQGKTVYLNSSGTIDTTSTGTRAGFAVQAAAADDASVQVLLNGR